MIGDYKLKPWQVDLLRRVAGRDLLIKPRQATGMHRRGLIRVVDQCRAGCCRVYTATPRGMRAIADHDDLTVTS